MEDGLDWTHDLSDLGQTRKFQRAAVSTELDAVTHLLQDSTCEAFEAAYKLKPLSPGRYRATGELKAVVQQICGVTLDPIHQTINEPFDVEFQSNYRPASQMEIDIDAFSDDDPEPIENGQIRIGRLLCEILISSLDPFPRAADVELERSEAGASDASDNPFAALEQLKSKS